MIRGGLYGFTAVSNVVLGYFVFITLVTTEGSESLVFGKLFITISLLMVLRLFVIECSVLCLQGGAEVFVALSRIQVILILKYYMSHYVYIVKYISTFLIQLQKLLILDDMQTSAIECPCTSII